MIRVEGVIIRTRKVYWQRDGKTYTWYRAKTNKPKWDVGGETEKIAVWKMLGFLSSEELSASSP